MEKRRIIYSAVGAVAAALVGTGLILAVWMRNLIVRCETIISASAFFVLLFFVFYLTAFGLLTVISYLFDKLRKRTNEASKGIEKSVFQALLVTVAAVVIKNVVDGCVAQIWYVYIFTYTIAFFAMIGIDSTKRLFSKE